MVIKMNDTSINTIEDIKHFINPTNKVGFSRESTKDTYAWVEKTLVRFRYMLLSKPNRGYIKKYIEKK